MFAPSAFSGLPVEHKLCSDATRLPMNSFHVRENCLGNHHNMKGASWKLSTKQKRQIKTKLGALVSSSDNSSAGFDSLSASEKTKQFYGCINRKDVNRLGEFISQDCVFDDFSFPKPFHGKKEVMNFLKQLVSSMGVNVSFNIGDLCEGDDFMIALTWHLEWNKKQIPFTRGCSFYKWAIEGAKLVIRNAQSVIEPPMKPGGSVLILLKVVSSLFDTFPQATEWFLKSPNVVLQMILRAYNLVLGPFISPFLAWYIKLWELLTGFLRYMLKILIFITKIFSSDNGE